MCPFFLLQCQKAASHLKFKPKDVFCAESLQLGQDITPLENLKECKVNVEECFYQSFGHVIISQKYLKYL